MKLITTITVEKEVELTRKLIEIRIGVELVAASHLGGQYWRHGISEVYEYPDGSKRIVDTGSSGFKDAEGFATRWIECLSAPELPAGPLTGKRIRAKGGADDEPFACDAESWEEGDHWICCDLGIPGGTLGTIGGYDAKRDEYVIDWEDGEKWGDTRALCRWSHAEDWGNEEYILAGAEIVEEGA